MVESRQWEARRIVNMFPFAVKVKVYDNDGRSKVVELPPCGRILRLHVPKGLGMADEITTTHGYIATYVTYGPMLWGPIDEYMTEQDEVYLVPIEVAYHVSMHYDLSMSYRFVSPLEMDGDIIVSLVELLPRSSYALD